MNHEEPNTEVQRMLYEAASRLLDAAQSGTPDTCARVLGEERTRLRSSCALLRAEPLLPQLWSLVAVGGIASGLRLYTLRMTECAERADRLAKEGRRYEEIAATMREDSIKLAAHYEALEKFIHLFEADGQAAAIALQCAFEMQRDEKREAGGRN